LIFGAFVAEDADWASATVPLTVVPYNITAELCRWHISVGQGSSNLPDISGKIYFTIYDLGGF
jgi:hypothetical protein